jgi:hypothetical protein
MHNPLEQSNSQMPACGDRLRRLPSEMPPPYNWQEFQRRSQQRLTAAKRLDWRHVAAAAALLLVVCGIAVWGRVGSSGRHVVAGSGVAAEGTTGRMSDARGPAGDVDALRDLSGAGGDARARAGAAGGGQAGDTAHVGADARTADVPRTSAATQISDAALAAVRTRAIESWLATLPREPIVVRVGTRAAVAGLEDRIAQVDDLLTSVRLDGTPPDRLAALQQERVRLVGSLAQVRYAEVVASESP